jgi:hypothetical protein
MGDTHEQSFRKNWNNIFFRGVDLLVLPDFIIDTYCGPYIGLTEPFK